MRRYCSRATCDALRQGERTATGASTFNLQTQDTTEWYVVPDDDPRLDTVEEVPPPARDFSKWARLIVEQVHDIYQNGQSEGLSAADIVERTLDQVFTAVGHDPRTIAATIGRGLWLAHVAEDGRLCFVEVPDDLDDRRLPLEDAARLLLMPALAALRQERAGA